MRRLRRQIVQVRLRRVNARQGELVQYDGKYAGKMRAKREARALCGVALKSAHLPLGECARFPLGMRSEVQRNGV